MNRHREKKYYAPSFKSSEGLEKGLYRSRNGLILGVFRGLAEYFDLSVFWLRTIGVIVFIFSGFWPIVVLYLFAALLMKKAPIIPLESIDEQEFYDSYTHFRKGSVYRMKRQFENLNRRIQRMEDVVTDKEFDWEQRLNS